MTTPIHAVFVYGTLKRGELRERCWPCKPLVIEWATLRGELRDLGEYPALIAGNDTILGELWILKPEDVSKTLAVLDEIEWYGQNDADLYIRRTMPVRTLASEAVTAFSYWYANPAELRLSPIVLADSEGFCHWTGD